MPATPRPRSLRRPLPRCRGPLATATATAAAAGGGVFAPPPRPPPAGSTGAPPEGTGAWLVGVGDLPGGDFWSRIHGLSGDGLVAVGTSYSANGTRGNPGCCEAFRWTMEGGLVALGDLPGSTFESVATATSDDGTVVVGRGHTGVSRAVRSVGGPLFEIPELPGGGIGGAGADGVSGDGRWIVGQDAAANGTEAFLFDAATGSITGLGDLAGGTFRSDADAISRDGTTVVGSSRAADGFEAFRWRADTGMVSLGELPGGGHFSTARATSADGGLVVGYSSTADGAEAFAHDGSTMIILPDLPGGEVEARALATNDDGTIIGGRANGPDGRRAVVWLGLGQPAVLVSDRLADAGVELGGWILEDVAALSADGRTLAGFGTNPSGQREGWVAHLPAACPADLDGDGAVGLPDLLAVLAGWGDAGPADLDGSGTVDLPDLIAVLAAWGPCV